MSSEALNFDSIIEKIVSYQGKYDLRYIDKFNKEAILKLIDEEDKTNSIQGRLSLYEPGGVDILSFVRSLLNLLPHSCDETLYLSMALIELFRDICESLNLNNAVRATDFSNYIVNKYLNGNMVPRGATTKKLPAQKKFQEETQGVRAIDLQAPIVYGNTLKSIKRLMPSKTKSDRARHLNKGIKKACFGPEAKKVFILDDFSNYIFVINLEGEVEKTLYAKGAPEKVESRIVDLAWSSRQGRLGVTLNDMTMSFWDMSDNFEFEKSFSIVKSMPEYQTNIWYVEFLNMWITTDQTSALTSWDILNETKIFTVSSDKIKGTIVDIAAIEVLKLVLIVSSDNKMSLMDFKKGLVVSQVDTCFGIHSIWWSSTYQVLMTAGWESNIKIWSIDPKFLEIAEIGKLQGHAGLVTAIAVIDSTPMLTSADDQGVIKIWDVRSLECLQTSHFKLKNSAKQMLDIFSHGKLGFVTHRVNFVEFDDADKMIQEKEQEELYPLHVEYNLNNNELVVCSKKDVRCIDIENGRVKRIYEGLLLNDKGDITVFKMMQKNRKFIIGDDKGHLISYDFASGERVHQLVSHTNEITNLRLDHTNGLIISGSYDSSVKIQKEGRDFYEVKRSLKNLHHHRSVSLMEVSLFHSLLVTASNNHMLYVWDYEFGKLLAIVEGQEGTEFTCLQFINGYSILLAADTSGKIHFLHLTRSDALHVHAQTLASIKIADEPEKNKKGQDPIAATKILVSLEYKDYEEDPSRHKMYISTSTGDVKSYKLSSFFQCESVKMGTHVNVQSSYNPERVTHEDFVTALKGYISPPFKIEPPHNSSSALAFAELSTSIEQGLREDFKAHDDALTTLTFLALARQKLLTSSLDGFIKIWTLRGLPLAAIKINQPLPTVWNLSKEATSFRYKTKIMCAIKLVESIFKKYARDMTLREKSNISIKEFCESLGPEPAKKSNRIMLQSKPMLPELPSVLEQKQVVVMADEYTPRDLNYERFQERYQKDFQGLSLKEQDRVMKAQGVAEEKEMIHEKKIDERYRKKAERKAGANESPEQNNFNDNFLDYMLKEDYTPDSEEYSAATLRLGAKLARSIQTPNTKARIKAAAEAVFLTIPKTAENSMLKEELMPSMWPMTLRASLSNSPVSQSPINKQQKKKLSLAGNESGIFKHSQVNLDPVFPNSVKSVQTPVKAQSVSRKSGLVLDQLNLPKLNLSRIKVPSLSVNRRPQGKSSERNNFFDYATLKLTGNADDPSSVSNSQNTSTTATATNKSYHLERVQQKRNFHLIMNKLNTEVLKSQFSSRIHRGIQPLYTDSITGAVTSSSRLLTDRLHSKVLDAPQEMNLLGELNSLKKETLDLQMTDQDRKKKYINEIMVKNLKKQSSTSDINTLELKKKQISGLTTDEEFDSLEPVFRREAVFKKKGTKHRTKLSVGGLNIGV